VISVAPDVLDPLLARLHEEFDFDADIGHLTVFGRCVDCPSDPPGDS
jgi:Fur family ferric uptake transcriptional regulator